MRVAKLLINWRFIEKLNQRDAAAMIGISATSLYRLEKKGVVPDGETLVKLINWLFAEEPKDAEEKAPSTNAGNQRDDAPSGVPEGS